MIRYSNSFFLSLIFHGSLLLSVWFFYNNDTKIEQEIPLKIPLKLSMMEAASQTTAQHQSKEEVCIVKPQEKPQKVQESPKEEKKIIQKKVEKKVEKKEEEKAEEKTVEEKVEKRKEEITPQPQKSVAQEIRKEVSSEQKRVPPPAEAKPYHQEYSELNAQKIVELLREHLYYPRSARQKGIVGVVKVKFTLDVDAKVYNITVVESSDEILSRAAIKTIEELSTKFPKPASKTTLTVPINYSLTSE